MTKCKAQDVKQDGRLEPPMPRRVRANGTTEDGEEAKTTRGEMTTVNPNTHFPHGADPSVSDATGSVAIAEAEKAAPGSTNMEKENKTPRIGMSNSDIHILQGVYAVRSGVASPVVNPAGEGTFQPQAKINAPAKVGRNEKCPCGSGKKYKKCCSLRGLVAAGPGNSDRNEITIEMAPNPLKHQPQKVGNTDEREFKQLGETLAENIEFYLSPEGNVEVAGYGIINRTTQAMSVVPSIRIHVKDMTDRLHAGGWLNEGDLIDQFSFVYDLSNLTILCLRRYVGTPEWIEERDPTAIAEIENELADNCAESWRALYPEALRRKLNMKAQKAPQAGRVNTLPAFLPTQAVG